MSKENGESGIDNLHELDQKICANLQQLLAIGLHVVEKKKNRFRQQETTAVLTVISIFKHCNCNFFFWGGGEFIYFLTTALSLLCTCM